MVLIHVLVGVAVVASGGVCAAVGLALRDDRPQWFQGAVGLTLGLLALQSITGVFLVTGSSTGLPAWHYLLPLASLGALIAARSVKQGTNARAIGASCALIVAAGIYAFMSAASRAV